MLYLFIILDVIPFIALVIVMIANIFVGPPSLPLIAKRDELERRI